METTKNHMSVLPPEIWTAIFDLVYNKWLDDLSTNDLWSCYGVCLTFQIILKPSRSLWLFQEVLPIISSYITNGSLNKTHPLLRCRLVCKAWKRAVDHFLETHDIYDHANLENGRARKRQIYSIAPLNLTGNIFTKPLPMCRLFTSEKVRLFISQMKSHHDGYPFPGKSLRLPHWPINADPIEYLHFWDVDIKELLSHFGQFITVLHLDLCSFSFEFGISSEQFCGTVKSCLAYTPNLRRLSINGFLNEPFLEVTGSLDNGVGCNNPLPRLGTIEFDDAGRHQYAIPFPLQYTISSSYLSQLKRLKLSVMETNFSKIDYSCLPSGCLPNLEEFEVTVESSSQFRNLSNLLSKSAKMNYVRIQISVLASYGPEVKLGEILIIAQTLFRNSLRTLVIVAKVPLHSYCTAKQKDLAILSDFILLKYLHLEGFLLCKLAILECLPRGLEYLALDGQLTWMQDDFKNAFMDLEYTNLIVSADLLSGKNTYYTRLWEWLPRLRWLTVAFREDGKLPAIYIYHREKWEWMVRNEKRVQREQPQVSPINRDTQCCSLV